MQAELDAADLSAGLRIVGINGKGLEAGNASICEGRDLPWLQDVPEQDVWISWEVEYRDVIILDGQNRRVAVFNLTDHDLGDPENYASLLRILKSAAPCQEL